MAAGRGGNGLDRSGETVTGLDERVEKRLWAGARAAWWIVLLLVGICGAALGAVSSYWHNDSTINSRITAVETKQSAQDQVLSTKQSKEAADAQTQIILRRLDEMDKASDARWQAIHDEIAMIERRR